MAEQTLMMVVGVVSTIFVGRIGNEAISAVGLINTLIAFIQVVFVALSTGSTVLVARLIGEGDRTNAEETVRQSVVLGLFSSLLISVLCYILAGVFTGFFFGNADKEIIRLAVLYFRITLFTFPLMILNIMISGVIRGTGDTKTPMLAVLIVNIINLPLSYVMIFGLDLNFVSFRGMGIAGAAVAVAISRGIGGVLMILALLLPSGIIKLRVPGRFRIDTGLLKRILNIGIPAAMEQVVMQGGLLVLQIVIAGMGTIAIAVYQIGMSINSICFVPIWGFGIAATTMIGQSLGARKPHVAEKCGWSTLKISMVGSLALTVAVFILAKALVSVYSSDPDVIKVGTEAIRIFSISQPFITVVVVIAGALRGAGDIRYVMATSFVGIWIFRVLLSVIINYIFNIGIMSVWTALGFDFLIRASMYLARYKRGRWKQIVV